MTPEEKTAAIESLVPLLKEAAQGKPRGALVFHRFPGESGMPRGSINAANEETVQFFQDETSYLVDEVAPCANVMERFDIHSSAMYRAAEELHLIKELAYD